MIGLVKKMLICESCEKKKRKENLTCVLQFQEKRKADNSNNNNKNMLRFRIATIIAIYRWLHPTDRLRLTLCPH